MGMKKVAVNFVEMCELSQVYFGYLWGTLKELIYISNLRGVNDLKHVSEVDKLIHSHKWASPCWYSVGIAFQLKNILGKKWNYSWLVCFTLCLLGPMDLYQVPNLRENGGLLRHLQKTIHLDSVISASQFFIILTMADWMWILHTYSYPMVFLFFIHRSSI